MVVNDRDDDRFVTKFQLGAYGEKKKENIKLTNQSGVALRSSIAKGII